MGAMASVFTRLFSKNQNVRLPTYGYLAVGLNSSGKTTILYRLKYGKVMKLIPTVGYNVETIECNNITFTVCDVNGRTRPQNLWRYYYQNTQAIIFVVDSSERRTIIEAKEELHNMLREDVLQDAVILILANKLDLPDAMNVAELTSELCLSDIQGHKWHIQGTSAIEGVGLHEGLNWLTNEIAKKYSLWHNLWG